MPLTPLLVRPVQALARLRFSGAVAQSDVDEALRLMQMSKMSLQEDGARRQGLDPVSDIYTILRDEAKKQDTVHVAYTEALNWITRKVRPRAREGLGRERDDEQRAETVLGRWKHRGRVFRWLLWARPRHKGTSAQSTCSASRPSTYARLTRTSVSAKNQPVGPGNLVPTMIAQSMPSPSKGPV